MKVLITGIEGFAGSHLAEYLLGVGKEVGGTFFPSSSHDNIAPKKNNLTLFECNIQEPAPIARIIEGFRPDWIFHLAASSSVRESEADYEATVKTNIIGTQHLLEALRRSRKECRLLFVSSCEVYGTVGPADLPIREDTFRAPNNTYGLTKLAGEHLCRLYGSKYGLQIVTVRPFNYIGPRQRESFVCSNFARQIAEIEMSKQAPVINVGNLEIRRDFIDVRDVVKAFSLALEHASGGACYNICSGTAYSIQHILDLLVQMSSREIELRVDPERLRKNDTPVLVGTAEKFRSATGWKPEYPLEKPLQAILDFWREKNAAG